MSRPRWLDVRVIGGVLLVVAAVVIGARVIGASSRTTPVWVAAHDLAAGTVLRTDDLVKAEVNLGKRGAAYLDAATSPAGRMLNRAVRSGELVPASAVGAVGDARIVSVAVDPERMAPGVRHGSVIDLYLTSGGSTLTDDDATTRLLQAGITVQEVTAPASGGLSGATSNRYQVALLLSPSDADGLVRALPTGDPLVVLRTSDGIGDGQPRAAREQAGTGPSGRPAVADGVGAGSSPVVSASAGG